MPIVEPSRVSCSGCVAVFIEERFSAPPAGSEFRQSKIQNFRVAALGNENVCGLNVAMNDSSHMRRIQRIGYLNCKTEQHFTFNWLAADALFQRHAIQIFHGDETQIAVSADLVERANVGMVQCRRRARLAAKSLQSLRIARQLVRQKLQRDKSPELGVLGLINNTHSAAAEFFDDAVMGNCAANEWLVFRHDCRES